MTNSIETQGAEIMHKRLWEDGHEKRLYRGSKPMLVSEGWARASQAEKVKAVFWPEKNHYAKGEKCEKYRIWGELYKQSHSI